jgi:tetratricopeptide (TPR) repeat protein
MAAMKRSIKIFLVALALILPPTLSTTQEPSALTDANDKGRISPPEASQKVQEGKRSGGGVKSVGDRCLEIARPLVKEGKIDEAIDSVQEVLSQNPGNTGCLLHLGFLFLGRDLLDDAEVAFEEVMKTRPKEREAQLGLGIIYAEKGELRRAQETLEKALVLNPHPVRVHYHLGMVSEKMGEPGMAIRHYKAGIDKYLKGRR